MTQEPVAETQYVSPLEQVAQMPAELTYEERADRRAAANALPRGTFITAPLNNLGNATGFDIAGQGSNLFEYRGGPIRVTDRKGNVLFSGEGPEAAAEAVKFAQNLSDTKGKKASWDIQQGERTIVDGSEGPMRWVSGPTDYKEGKGLVGDIIGTALPLAVMAIPGVGQLGLALKMATAAAAGGMGAAFRDADPLKAAITAGLSAAGGDVIGKALEGGGALGTNLAPKLATSVGTGVGATAGGLATGQNLQDALLSGAASGAASYVSPDVIKALGAGAPTSTSTGGGGDGFDGINVAGGRIIPASVSVGGAKAPAPAKLAELEPPATIVSGSGSPFAAAFPIPANFLSGALPATAQPEPAAEQMPEEDIIKVTGQLPGATPSVDLGSGLSPRVIDQIAQPAETLSPEEILVEARKSFTPVSVTSPIATDFMPETVLPKPTLDVTDTVSPEEILVEARKLITPSVPVGGALSPEVLRAVEGPVKDEIVVTGNRPGAVAPLTIPGFDTPMPDMAPPKAAAEADAKKKLGVKDYIDIATLLMGLIPGASGGGGGGSRGTIPAGMGTLSPLFSKQLPPPTLPGGVGGGALPASTLAAQGLRSPQDYYRYGYGPEQSFFSYATQGAPNTSRAYTGYEGSTAEDLFAPQPSRLPQPITTPIPEEPRGPSMYAPEVDDVRFARGGFAVEGAGDGRDDKIPALLSDGEYVIDAETVALLGNGSNKAGAKLLDSFRVKVRKQKGKKLARGEFSDNAKRPEHYMAGGKS
jgi:hypothetical protein